MFDPIGGGEARLVPLTLYTDACVIRGSVRSRQRRITDILNSAEEPFLVVSDVTIDEYGSRGIASRSEYAQINLGAVLFAVSDELVEARPDLRTPKVPEVAMITIPPRTRPAWPGNARSPQRCAGSRSRPSERS